MKRNLKSIPGQSGLIGIFIIAAALILPGCTKNFEKYNTDPTKLSAAQTVAIAATAFGPMEQAIYSNYQIAQNLSADAWAGYMMSPTNFRGGINNLNYALVDGWNSTGFNDQYKLVMAPVSKIAQAGTATKAPDVWAVALLIQVEAMDRVTDRFGPIPYTKAGSSLTSIPYDDQQTVYQTFFKQIDTAVINLRAFTSNPANAGKNPIGTGDLVYSGNYAKWQKFANSLRLRLAMRIVKADPTTAQQQAEKAMSDPAGLLTSPGDDAAVAQSGTRNNDLWTVTIAYNGDNHLNAAMGSYLDGFKDPRAPIYSVPATDGTYKGIRLGIDVSKGAYKTLASYNCLSTFTQTSPQLIMTAAEMWFLRAEAALRHWKGVGGVVEDPQVDYETGITTSMQQWGVTPGTYLSDATSKQVNYVDPINAANSTPAISTITIKWDPAATDEQKLERIITQKWIAIFPDGQEAWADYRRTGYPKLFPVAQNFSTNPVIDATIQIRRIPYPSSEYQTNATAVANGIKLLGGTGDNGNSRLWWDVNKGNF